MYLIKGKYKSGFWNGKCFFRYAEYTLNDKLNKTETSGWYASLGNFSNGLASILYNDKYGFIDEKGELKIPIQYLGIISPFKNNRAFVRNSENLGVIINTQGKFVDYTPFQKEIFQKIAKKERNKALSKRYLYYEADKSFTHNIWEKKYKKDASGNQDKLLMELHYYPGGVYIYDENGNFKFSEDPPYISIKTNFINDETQKSDKGTYFIYDSNKNLITEGKGKESKITIDLTEDLLKYFPVGKDYIHITYRSYYKVGKHIIDSTYCPFIRQSIERHKKRKEEKAKILANIITQRLESFSNIQEGDMLVFSANWTHTKTEGWFIFKTTRDVHFKNLTYLIVESVKGDRVKVTANRTESRGGEEKQYETNQYNGLNLYRGATIYISKKKLAYDNRFKLYEL